MNEWMNERMNNFNKKHFDVRSLTKNWGNMKQSKLNKKHIANKYAT